MYAAFSFGFAIDVAGAGGGGGAAGADTTIWRVTAGAASCPTRVARAE